MTAILLTTAALILAAPTGAMAAETGSDDAPGYCWADLDTQRTTCFETEAAMDDAVVARTGTAVVENVSELSAASRSRVVALASPILLARLYQNASYGGTYIQVTSTDPDACVSVSVQQATMPSGWDNVVSSFRSYNGCTTRLYTGTSYSGSSELGGNKATLTYNDQASSYRVY